MSLNLDGFELIETRGYWRYVNHSRKLATTGFYLRSMMESYKNDLADHARAMTAMSNRYTELFPAPVVKSPRKTATVAVYHVYGTKSTESVTVRYQGKLLWHDTANESANTMLQRGRDWAHSHGFTHCNIVSD